MGVHFQVNPPPLVFGDLYDFVELTADASGYGPCKLETWVWQLWQLQRKIVSEWQLPVSLRHMLLAKMTSLDSCYSRSQSTFKKGDVHSSSNKQIFKLQFRCHINFKHNQSIIKAYHKFRIWFISYHYLHHLLYKYLEIKLSKPMWIYLHEMSWSNMSRGIRLREKNQPPESLNGSESSSESCYRRKNGPTCSHGIPSSCAQQTFSTKTAWKKPWKCLRQIHKFTLTMLTLADIAVFSCGPLDFIGHLA